MPTTGHAQATEPPTVEQQTEIVNFELGLFSPRRSQTITPACSTSTVPPAAPQNLAATEYYPGINDVLGADPHKLPFNSSASSLFSAWENSVPDRRHGPIAREVAAARADIAAGETLFNTRPINITAVRGINDNPAVATALAVSLPVASFSGTCTTCHDTPNVGDHSLPLPLDIGLVHDAGAEHDPAIANSLAQLTRPTSPSMKSTVARIPSPNLAATTPNPPIYTTDPGKALLTGSCGDVNRVKGPVLRGLASRAPYFHNGSARDLSELLNFYNQRFQMNLTPTEKRQLIAFLNSL